MKTARTVPLRRVRRLAVVASPADVPCDRPVTRADCEPGEDVDRRPHAERPCPFVSCRHHLYLEAKPSGGITVMHGSPDEDDPAAVLAAMPYTCNLDAIDAGVSNGRLADMAKALGFKSRQHMHSATRRAILACEKAMGSGPVIPRD